MNKTEIYIILILAGLTFCISFGLSAPSLFINDEWITVNQLNQLSTGTQLIENEGKYGKTIFGENSAYFVAHGNYLAYSIFLPLVSLPTMKIIMWSGESFRLLFLTLWFLSGIVSLLLCILLMSHNNKKCNYYLIWIILFLFSGLFLANIYYYQPFAASEIDSPIESAAVIFTNEILFSLMSPLIFLIFRNLSFNLKFALVGTISVLCCSTYLFWSASAKDHLLIAFLLTVLFWIFSSIINRESTYKWIIFFFIAGLLCWARPEYGTILIIGLIFGLIFSFIYSGAIFDSISKKIIKIRIIPGIVGLFLGLLPFFINNYVITGNPLIPTQYLYFLKSRSISQQFFEPESTEVVKTTIFTKMTSGVGQVSSFFSPDIQNGLIDIPGLFFSPPNGGVGILFICPIILPAVLYGLIKIRSNRNDYSKEIKLMILFSTFIIFLTFVAYLRVLHGSTLSAASLPDMRYFSPIYLPLSIISVLLLSPLINPRPLKWLKCLLISVFLIAPILVILCTIILPFGISYHMYVYFFMRILIILLILIFALVAWNHKLWESKLVFPALFSFLLMIPCSFQFLHLFIFSINKSNGYLFWQPIIQYLFTNVLYIID